MLFSCILWSGKAVGARKKQNSRNPEKRISAIFTKSYGRNKRKYKSFTLVPVGPVKIRLSTAFKAW